MKPIQYNSCALYEETDPGLRLGSSQTFLVREFSDDSIELSVLALCSMNADFDGDELSGMFVFGKSLVKEYLRLMPHYDAHSNRKPGEFSNAMEFPKTAVLNIHCRLESEEFVEEFNE